MLGPRGVCDPFYIGGPLSQVVRYGARPVGSLSLYGGAFLYWFNFVRSRGQLFLCEDILITSPQYYSTLITNSVDKGDNIIA